MRGLKAFRLLYKVTGFNIIINQICPGEDTKGFRRGFNTKTRIKGLKGNKEDFMGRGKRRLAGAIRRMK